MPNLKALFGAIAVFVPVVWAAGLIYYFVDTSGSIENAETIGLGPTLLGLGLVGILFAIPFIVRVGRIFGGPRSPGSSGHTGPNLPTDDGSGGIDTDAAIARYLASRSVETSPGAPAAPQPDRDEPAARPSFGRRVR